MFDNTKILLNQGILEMKADQKPFSPETFRRLLSSTHQTIATYCPENSYLTSTFLWAFCYGVIECSKDIQYQNRAYIREMCKILCPYSKKTQIKKALCHAMRYEATLLFGPLLDNGAPVPLQNIHELDHVRAFSVAKLFDTMNAQCFVVSIDQLLVIGEVLIKKWPTLKCIFFDTSNDSPLASENLRSIFLNFIELRHRALLRAAQACEPSLN